MTGIFDSQFGGAVSMPGQPIPIKAKLAEAVPFPVDKLSPKLRAAVEAIRDKAQVPDAIAAQAVLGAAALAAQCRINIELPTGEEMPCSLFLFTVASSGDRKSTADKLALAPVYRREADLRRAYQDEQHRFLIDQAAYKAAVAAATKKGGSDRRAISENVTACGTPPLPPPTPMLLIDEGTIEAIVKLLGDAMPSLGLFSDEGANMLGGYSMGEERKTATTAQLSQMWDGKPIKRVRASEVVQFLPGRRLSVHLMVQPGVALKVFADKAARDQGMMSRMLCAFPRTRKGERLWQDTTPEADAALRAYYGRLEQLLQAPMEFVDPMTRELRLEKVTLSPEARTLYVQFNDHIERQIGPGGNLEEISDLASKLAQHAMRLAAVIAYFENGPRLYRADRAGEQPAGISAQAFSVGIQLAQFYASEALRLYNAGSVDEDSDNAAALIEFIHKKGLKVVGLRHLSQTAPKNVRPAKVLRRAVEVLVEHGHLHRIKEGAHIDVAGKQVFQREAYTVIVADEADA